MPNATPVIVVLDDEPEIQKALRRLLTGKGFVVETYGRGEDLIAALASHWADCLVLDLHMPKVNGFDVLAAFESQHVVTPVVVITGHDKAGRRSARFRWAPLTISPSRWTDWRWFPRSSQPSPRRTHSQRLEKTPRTGSAILNANNQDYPHETEHHPRCYEHCARGGIYVTGTRR